MASEPNYSENRRGLKIAQGHDRMKADEHQELAYRTSKTSYEPLTHQQFELLHAVLGLASEVGEIADNVKKHIIYGQPLNRGNLVEEQGDVDWYGALLMTAIQELRSVALSNNIEKLRRRYPDGYTDLAAIARADKVDEPKVTSNLMPVCSKCDEPLCKFDNLILCKSELICRNNKCERWGLEGPG